MSSPPAAEELEGMGVLGWRSHDDAPSLDVDPTSYCLAYPDGVQAKLGPWSRHDALLQLRKALGVDVPPVLQKAAHHDDAEAAATSERRGISQSAWQSGLLSVPSDGPVVDSASLMTNVEVLEQECAAIRQWLGAGLGTNGVASTSSAMKEVDDTLELLDKGITSELRTRVCVARREATVWGATCDAFAERLMALEDLPSVPSSTHSVQSTSIDEALLHIGEFMEDTASTSERLSGLNTLTSRLSLMAPLLAGMDARQRVVKTIAEGNSAGFREGLAGAVESLTTLLSEMEASEKTLARNLDYLGQRWSSVATRRAAAMS